MTPEKATILLSLSAYRLEGLREPSPGLAPGVLEPRSELSVSRVIANVPSTGLSVVELVDGRAAAMWESHGSLHESVEALLAPNKHPEIQRAAQGLPDPVLNTFEYDRVSFIMELRKAGVAI